MTYSCYEISTADQPQYSVIWLHGLGGSPDEFMQCIPKLALPAALAIHFVFPIAPAIPVTFLGYYLSAWFDIKSISKDDRDIDQIGFENSVKSIHRLIDREIASGIPAEHVYLAGFSQGGFVAYAAALTYPKKLGGLMALSTYMPDLTWLLQHQQKHVQLPILIMHGRQDSIVSLVRGRMSNQLLKQLGYQPSLVEFDMQHEVSDAALQCMSHWMQAQMS